MYTPNDPSDEKFFWVPYKYVYILLLVHVSVTLSRVCMYILGPILPYFIFQQCVNYARDSHFHDMIVYQGVEYKNQVS